MTKRRIHFNDALGKAFRVVQTPSGHARDFRTNEVLPDNPDRFSIVTPLNTNHPPTDTCAGCSQWDWPDASPEAHETAKKNFGRLFTDRRHKYKGRQIRKSMK